ncbi:hypothetical protein SLW70_09300 [Flavobacterium sp. NG2]|uniref:hypothetical protein n=1 Tax=Flavobacterium sp. NG2 TaxID=3097547 RepID=UPI002A8127F6|nr:hypothetical protein [Flavobacterium sp. NG2]WPR70146.1 hypothetical protein SLW70_09300 [Flavobacterium sp. NG2]
MIKGIISLIACFILLSVGARVFMYFFTKSPGPIMEYEFSNMTYEQLETRISEITTTELNSRFHLTQKELQNTDNGGITRVVILGKDSLQFGFVTRMDKVYEYKTKKRHTNGSLPWLELFSICNSKGKYIGVFRKNREEHPELIKLFEDKFIKKVNDGKFEVIERGFWDWF